jgi:hypothetical protein
VLCPKLVSRYGCYFVDLLRKAGEKLRPLSRINSTPGVVLPLGDSVVSQMIVLVPFDSTFILGV